MSKYISSRIKSYSNEFQNSPCDSRDEHTWLVVDFHRIKTYFAFALLQAENQSNWYANNWITFWGFISLKSNYVPCIRQRSCSCVPQWPRPLPRPFASYGPHNASHSDWPWACSRWNWGWWGYLALHFWLQWFWLQSPSLSSRPFCRLLVTLDVPTSNTELGWRIWPLGKKTFDGVWISALIDQRHRLPKATWKYTIFEFILRSFTKNKIEILQSKTRKIDKEKGKNLKKNFYT